MYALVMCFIFINRLDNNKCIKEELPVEFNSLEKCKQFQHRFEFNEGTLEDFSKLGYAYKTQYGEFYLDKISKYNINIRLVDSCREK